MCSLLDINYLIYILDMNLFGILNRLDRRRVLFLTGFLISLVMLKITQSGIIVSYFCNQTIDVKCEFTCRTVPQLDEQFSFPEVNNETEVLLKPLNVSHHYIKYQHHEQETGNTPENVAHPAFQPGLSQEERQIMLVLFQTFIRACVKFRISFFLYGGSLLGSLRHHDIIPWDDDVDVILNSSDKLPLLHALSTTGDRFAVFSPRDKWWKFYWTNTNSLPDKNFRWPYIDIFFFEENITHIFDESVEYKQTFSFPKNTFFPSSFHPFAGAMLPVPCKLQSIVTNNYSPGLCMSPKYSHKFELTIPRVSQRIISCKTLHQYYPFVYRRVSGDYVHEDLIQGKKVINTVTISKQCS